MLRKVARILRAGALYDLTGDDSEFEDEMERLYAHVRKMESCLGLRRRPLGDVKSKRRVQTRDKPLAS